MSDRRFIYRIMILCTTALLGAPVLAAPNIVLPMERSAYFIGEQVPLGLGGVEGAAKLEAVNASGKVVLYEGDAKALMLDTSKLAAGDYELQINGQSVMPRFTLTSVVRKSPASVQDEVAPAELQFPQNNKFTPEEAQKFAANHWDSIVQTIRESGITAIVHDGDDNIPRHPYLDALARTGTLEIGNPDGRPTSFLPTKIGGDEPDSMSQRMILGAQANGRYPNYGGFCYGWDTTGYAISGRKMLLTYWGWNGQEDALRKYIERGDAQMGAEFAKRTGYAPVPESEYVAYLLSINRPEFATAIDLPSKRWLEVIAKYTKPMEEKQRQEFEKRLDAWSSFLMNQYNEVYSIFSKNIREVDPSLRSTSSVQVDHCVVRYGQYFRTAYAPLDFQYQSTWNDQVGGPDYAFQGLYTQALLRMSPGEKPTWISNTLAAAHERAKYPGKFARVAAHGLAYGSSGIGFALEGFSNVLGGMNAGTNWKNIKGKSGEADLDAGREFLDRFAPLALAGRGDHQVGILFSRSQLQRQHLGMCYGSPSYKVLVTLARLGYTPRFITEEDLMEGNDKDIKALVVTGQMFEMPKEVNAELENFAKAGGRVLVDGNTTVKLPGAQPLGATLPLSQPGKPHNWGVPNVIEGDNDAYQSSRWHEELAPAFAKALGSTGQGIFSSEKGIATNVTLLQIDGGRDAKYVVAVNDSHVSSQADWFQLQEKLNPTKNAPADAIVYDATDEKAIGKIGPVDCDLSATTARVYAVLPRAIKGIDLSATQKQTAGGDVIVRVQFQDEAKQPLAAVVSFHLALLGPGGQAQREFYRATDRDGNFSIALPIPANALAGAWSVEVRCQLDGSVATLPVTIGAGEAKTFASALAEPVVVRGKSNIEPMLQKGAKIILPVFDSPDAEQLMPVAEKIKAVLAAKGIEVEIRRNPEVTKYVLGYDLTDAQKAENARADSGETFGALNRMTTNGNDWFSAASGWRFGKPVILLDLLAVPRPAAPVAAAPAAKPAAPPKPVVSISASLRSASLLWPSASSVFPGNGRAIVHGVAWALAPHVNTIVIQATDIQGLMAGAESLANLPEDRISTSIESVRSELWRQYHIGGLPQQPTIKGLTSDGLKLSQSSQPFAITFPDIRPPTADQVKPRMPLVRKATTLPAVFEPKQFVSFMRDADGSWIEAGTAGMLIPDLRFSEGVLLIGEMKEPAKLKVVAQGIFRYSDSSPRSQPVWEDVLDIYAKLVPKKREPMEIGILIDGKPAGKLLPTKTDQKDVQLDSPPGYSTAKPKTVREEVVTEFVGEIDLPTGRQEILLVPQHIVDGKLDRVSIGQ